MQRLLFGDSIVHIPPDRVRAWLKKYDFSGLYEEKPSFRVAELGQLHSSMDANYRSSPTIPPDVRSRVLIKPNLLFGFLQKALEDEYDYLRVVYHTSTREGCDGIRNSETGFSLKNIPPDPKHNGAGPRLSSGYLPLSTARSTRCLKGSPSCLSC